MSSGPLPTLLLQHRRPPEVSPATAEAYTRHPSRVTITVVRRHGPFERTVANRSRNPGPPGRGGAAAGGQGRLRPDAARPRPAPGLGARRAHGRGRPATHASRVRAAGRGPLGLDLRAEGGAGGSRTAPAPEQPAAHAVGAGRRRGPDLERRAMGASPAVERRRRAARGALALHSARHLAP